jgi:hypothetical protein
MRKLLTIFVCLQVASLVFTLPNVYYAQLGDTVTMQCSGGPYACFSTYSLQNQPSPMVTLNISSKYQLQMGSITLTQVQATDAGFYACANNCFQVQANQISYYLQPMCKLCTFVFECPLTEILVLPIPCRFSEIITHP